ncbi:MRC [Mytilus coruscus]|uniref:MRC n=1 Tax=Mytilus coruscus TaxID=42192 RepID=A0A6J8CY14_MYTCO|nr:MRC [Mytilus coruscus]
MDCWSIYGKSEYIIMTNQGGADYERAIGICQEMNASLVSVHSKDEDKYIDNLREQYAGVPVWIGMRSFGIGLVHIWSDETPIDYLPKIERISMPLEVACVYVYYNWYEGDCDNSLHFVCKRIAVNSSQMCTTTSPIPTTIVTTSSNTIKHSNSQITGNEQTTESETKSTNQEYTNDELTTDSMRRTPDQITPTIQKSTEEGMNNLQQTTLSHGKTDNILSEEELSTNSLSSKKDQRQTRSTTVTLKSTTQKPAPLLPHEIDEKVQEIVKNLKIYNLPKRSAREAPGGEAIGAVALFILIGILGGIVLLDLVTIQNHLKLFMRNIRRRPYKTKRKHIEQPDDSSASAMSEETYRRTV